MLVCVWIGTVWSFERVTHCVTSELKCVFNRTAWHNRLAQSSRRALRILLWCEPSTFLTTIKSKQHRNGIMFDDWQPAPVNFIDCLNATRLWIIYVAVAIAVAYFGQLARFSVRTFDDTHRCACWKFKSIASNPVICSALSAIGCMSVCLCHSQWVKCRH